MNNSTKITYVVAGNWKNVYDMNCDINYLSNYSSRIHKAEGFFEGLKETSLIIEGDNNSQDVVNDLAFQHTQKSFLKVYNDNSAFIVESDSDKEFYIGQWQKAMPYKDEAYTKIVGIDGKDIYYVCRK